MQDRKQSPAAIPDSDQFRNWLVKALAATEQRPAPFGQRLGLGKNTLRDFLQTPGRDLRLSTASRVAAELQVDAQERDVTLPPLLPVAPRAEVVEHG